MDKKKFNIILKLKNFFFYYLKKKKINLIKYCNFFFYTEYTSP